jgi:MFS transporter, putative metabolite:H+ symporter
MIGSVNAGARLDRLPISAFHRRIMWLIGIGMFFDGFDIYLAGNVLGSLLKSGFSTLALNAQFISMTFAGMVVGAFCTGFIGDRLGRRFTYQVNLAVFGFASIAAAFAPSMAVLIALRLVIGIGLGAETVVGYSTLTEFVPPSARGKWVGGMAVFVVTGLPVASLIGSFVIPAIGWRWMFVLAGLGALVVWYLRKQMPESPRWLESVGRTAEAERTIAAIEAEVAKTHPLPPVPPARPAAPAASQGLFSPEIVPRLIVGAVTMIVVNTLIYGFVTWLPSFFVKEGLSIAQSFWFTLLMSFGAPVGAAIGALTADSWGRKPTIIGASLATIVFGAIYPFVHDPVLLPLVGFLLVVPIYVLVAVLIGIYVSELFPTEIRMRGSGISNTFGRAATIVTPFAVVALFSTHGVGGVLGLMIALLLIQIAVVATLGVEPRNRALEELNADAASAPVPVQV